MKYYSLIYINVTNIRNIVMGKNNTYVIHFYKKDNELKSHGIEFKTFDFSYFDELIIHRHYGPNIKIHNVGGNFKEIERILKSKDIETKNLAVHMFNTALQKQQRKIYWSNKGFTF